MRVVAMTLVVALLVGCAGCDGGGPASHADFVGDSARICRTANTRFARIRIAPVTATGADATLARIVAVGTAALSDLRRVEVPKTEERAVDAWLGALEQTLDEIAYARSLLHGDEIVRAVGALARAEVLTRRARVLGRDLGVARACAVPRVLPAD